jgi:hypothetical protein
MSYRETLGPDNERQERTANEQRTADNDERPTPTNSKRLITCLSVAIPQGWAGRLSAGIGQSWLELAPQESHLSCGHFHVICFDVLLQVFVFIHTIVSCLFLEKSLIAQKRRKRKAIKNIRVGKKIAVHCPVTSVSLSLFPVS